MNHLNGACPRFGSCHLRLRRTATERATLIFGDSAAKPTDLGLIDAFAPVLAPLLEAVASGAGALGRADVDVRSFVGGLLRGDHVRGRGVFAPAMTHALNDYIEARQAARSDSSDRSRPASPTSRSSSGSPIDAAARSAAARVAGVGCCASQSTRV